MMSNHESQGFFFFSCEVSAGRICQCKITQTFAGSPTLNWTILLKRILARSRRQKIRCVKLSILLLIRWSLSVGLYQCQISTDQQCGQLLFRDTLTVDTVVGNRQTDSTHPLRLILNVECGFYGLTNAHKHTHHTLMYVHARRHTHAYTPIRPSMQASTHPHMQTHTNTHAPRYLWPLIVSGQCRPQQPGSWECCGAGQGSHCGNLLNIAYPEACYYPEKLSSFSPQNRPAQSI